MSALDDALEALDAETRSYVRRIQELEQRLEVVEYYLVELSKTLERTVSVIEKVTR